MLKIVCGSKGSGKTRKMVEELNQLASDEHMNVVCIERGDRLDDYVKPQIRLVDANQYPITSFDRLIGFISGIAAKDFDLNVLYIDSIFKVAQSEENFDSLVEFAHEANKLAKQHDFEIEVILSAQINDLPDALKNYAVCFESKI